jgi:hypothetical protein
VASKRTCKRKSLLLLVDHNDWPRWCDIWMYSSFILVTFFMFMDGDWYDECGQQVGYEGPNRGCGGDALKF